MFSSVNGKNILHLKTNILPLKTIENINIFYSLKTFYSGKKNYLLKHFIAKQ